MRRGMLRSLFGSVPSSAFFDQLIFTMSPLLVNFTPLKILERFFV